MGPGQGGMERAPGNCHQDNPLPCLLPQVRSEEELLHFHSDDLTAQLIGGGKNERGFPIDLSAGEDHHGDGGWGREGEWGGVGLLQAEEGSGAVG